MIPDLDAHFNMVCQTIENLKQNIKKTPPRKPDNDTTVKVYLLDTCKPFTNLSSEYLPK